MWFNDEARLLSEVAGSIIVSSDNSSDFHAEIWSVLPIFSKNL